MSQALGMRDICSGKIQALRGADGKGERLCVLQAAKLEGRTAQDQQSQMMSP